MFYIVHGRFLLPELLIDVITISNLLSSTIASYQLNYNATVTVLQLIFVMASLRSVVAISSTAIRLMALILLRWVWIP